MQRWLRSGLLAVAASALVPAAGPLAGTADAQILRGVREAARKAAERQVDRTVRCAMDDQACADKARREGKTVETVDAAGKPVPAADAKADAKAGAAASGPAASTAFVNFDFVPGERILFEEDYARDNVGDFPRRLEFVKGNMEVAEWQGARWVRGTSWPGVFAIPLRETLPERFTVEMMVAPGRPNTNVELHFSDRAEHLVTARFFNGKAQGGITTQSTTVAVASSQEELPFGTPFLLRVMADGRYVKVYVNGTRVANVPNAQIGRANRITVEFPGSEETPGWIGNIRVAAGGKDLYDALSETGRVATQGVFFDTGSDRIRPESAPTLKQIGDMLKAHADLKLLIEGHTDNVGDDAANLALSEKRAAAVKAYLEREHGVSADRLTAKGLGETKPAAGNDTPEGRQQNRRVELVKQ